MGYPLPEGFSDFDMSFFGILLFAEGLLGLFLNSVSALSFILVKGQRDPSNFLVFNLNIADILLNINALVAAYATYTRVWPFGAHGCNMHGFEGLTAVYASIAFIALVSWDKYHYWCTQQELYWATSGTMCVCVWVAAIFWAALPLPSFGWGEFGFEPMKNACCLDYTKNDWAYISYLLTVTAFYLLIPMLIMHSSYDSIYAYFKKTHKYKFNTVIPEACLLLTWGPYVFLCLYACFYNPKDFTPKLRMMLPVLAKTSPLFNAVLYSFTNAAYKGGIWTMITGEKSTAKKTN
ncbi:RPE-retinal G protein-coupled receptor-like [Engraulis encrasicolus]|uniref:RPE-retinal G protein-coupled receptor-like n=1 Tax=Engraulis encrasicolus TaxID=184585 RepID=UPI002FD3A6E4